MSPGRNEGTRRLLLLRAFTYKLRESLFYLPALCVFASVGATFAVRAIGNRINPLPLDLSSDAAITLLATIAGAVITTAGVVFSITIVSVQLASQQFSPRVVRGYFRDRFGQVVVGTLVATFAFCVLSLRDVGTDTNSGTPDLTVEVAIVLAITAVLMIIAYLDRGARNLYVGNLLRHIAEETIARHEQLCAEATDSARADDVPTDHLGPGWPVPAASDGWVQQMSSDGILRAVPAGSVVRLDTRVGAFIVQNAPLATVWPVPNDTESVRKDMAAAVLIGDNRTMQQDIDFGLRQLNDVALRALSTAINDPTTAIEAILRVVSVMHRVLSSPLPSQVRTDANGSVLLRPWDLDHAEYVVHAFAQVRGPAAAHPAIVAVLVRGLRQLAQLARRSGHEHAAAECDQQLRLTLEAAENAHHLDADLQWIDRVVNRPLAH
jgi:uncharacterized membrane protein